MQMRLRLLKNFNIKLNQNNKNYNMKKFVKCKISYRSQEIEICEGTLYEIIHEFNHVSMKSGTGVVVVDRTGNFGVFDSGFFE